MSQNSSKSGLDAKGLPIGYTFRPDWEVTPREVKAMQDSGADFLLIDCRTPMEYQIARIPGAVLVPLQELGAKIDDLEAHAEKKIVIHCHHGGRSLQMTSILRQRGFVDVKSMAGGIDIWAMDLDPGMRRY